MMKEGNEMENQTINQSLPRYLRIVYAKRRLPLINDLIAENFKKDSEKGRNNYDFHLLSWFPSFLALPGNISLNEFKERTGIDYKVQGLFPMDISSALSVKALNITHRASSSSSSSSASSLLTSPSPGNLKVLDLCCCPGAKYLMLSECLSKEDTLIGVDISEKRLQTCKALLEYWQSSFATEAEIPHQYLFQSDGRVFGPNTFGSLVFASEVFINELHDNTYRKKKNKSARKRINDQLKLIQERFNLFKLPSARVEDNCEQKDIPLNDFDYVLVDAECTHDASYRHMKYVEQGVKWLKRPTDLLSKDLQNNKMKRRKCSDVKPGSFFEDRDTENEAEREEEEDFWDKEYTAEAVEHFIQSHKVENVKAKENLEIVTERNALGQPHNLEEERIEKSGKSITLTHNIRDLKVSSDGKITLRDLQRSLIQNAFHLLKVGGVLVYSTCSQEEDQNENIVRWLLENHLNAELDPLVSLFSDFSIVKLESELDANISPLEVEKVTLLHGTLHGTVRVNYKVGMSGHFIARIKKL